jgi:hypothetical protein
MFGFNFVETKSQSAICSVERGVDKDRQSDRADFETHYSVLCIGICYAMLKSSSQY